MTSTSYNRHSTHIYCRYLQALIGDSGLGAPSPAFEVPDGVEGGSTPPPGTPRKPSRAPNMERVDAREREVELTSESEPEPIEVALPHVELRRHRIDLIRPLGDPGEHTVLELVAFIARAHSQYNLTRGGVGSLLALTAW
jgi:hypothetical protein